MLEDGDMRMLGAVDGYAHALVDVRMKIALITYYKINPRHTRKIAARETQLRPLRELEEKFRQAHTDCKAAYEKTRQPKPPIAVKHYYQAHQKFPWFCRHCGYPEIEALKHFQRGETVKPSVPA